MSVFSTLVRWCEPTPTEDFLLACCAGASHSALAKARATAIQNRLDWQSIRRRLGEYPFGHDTGLLWPGMVQIADAVPIPSDVLGRVRGMFSATAGVNKVQLLELAHISAAMDRCGIPCIVRKGPALILLSYHDPGARRTGDIDLLVEIDCIDAAEECLRELGYSSRLSRSEYERRRSLYKKLHHHLPPLFRTRDSGQVCVVEVQWYAAYHPSAEAFTRKVWENTITVRCGDSDPLRVPSPAFLLVNAILDAWSHEFAKGLRPLCDLWALSNRPSPASMWDVVWREIRTLGIEIEAVTVFSIVSHLLGGGHAPWPYSFDHIEIPGDLQSAAQECSLRSCPDRLLTWATIARLFYGRLAVSPTKSVLPVFHAPQSQASSLLSRSVRQGRRVFRTLPACRASIRNEYARLVIERWSQLRWSPTLL